MKRVRSLNRDGNQSAPLAKRVGAVATDQRGCNDGVGLYCITRWWFGQMVLANCAEVAPA